MDYDKLKEIKEKFVEKYMYKFFNICLVRPEVEIGGLLVGVRDQKNIR